MKKIIVFLTFIFLAWPVSIYAQSDQERAHDPGFFLRFFFPGVGGGSFTGEPDKENSIDYQATTPFIHLQIGGTAWPNWAFHIGAFFTGSTSANESDDVEIVASSTLAEDIRRIQDDQANRFVSGKQLRTSSTQYLLGVVSLGATYYFVDDHPYFFDVNSPIISGLYFSPELRISLGALLQTEFYELAGGSRDSDNTTVVRNYYGPGFGFGITIGKEWWVNADWGLGIALMYYQDSFTGDDQTIDIGKAELTRDLDSDATHRYFGFAFSATYN